MWYVIKFDGTRDPNVLNIVADKSSLDKKEDFILGLYDQKCKEHEDEVTYSS